MLDLEQTKKIKEERQKSRAWKAEEVLIGIQLMTEDFKNFSSIKSVYVDGDKTVVHLGGDIVYNKKVTDKVTTEDLFKDFIGIHPNGIMICGAPEANQIIMPPKGEFELIK